MPLPALPASRKFITDLLDTLSAVPSPSGVAGASDAAASNPLVSASDPVKKQLLALHVLFPNEFLPALDLLDRRLVTRFRIREPPGHATKEQAAPPPQDKNGNSNRADENSGNAQSGGGDGHKENEAVTRTESRQSGKTSAPNPPVVPAVGRTNPSDADQDTEMLDMSLLEAPAQKEMTHLPQIPEAEGQVAQQKGVPVAQEDTSQEEAEDGDTVYYVRSAQQRSSRYSTSYESTSFYEVRLRAWNCSCPAFAFAAFPNLHPEPSIPTTAHDPSKEWAQNGGAREASDAAWFFGGLSLGDRAPPVCKHLLACVLVERCKGLFGPFLQERDVSVEEAAGWAAGWAD